NNVGSVEVNAFQVHSRVVVQKSIREGFGLTVSEALWKGRPTVAGRVGGIVVQISDGETGWLVDSAEACAKACLDVLDNPAGLGLCAGRNTCGRTSSRRASSATGSPSSTVSRATTSTPSWRLRARDSAPPAGLGSRGGVAPEPDRRLEPGTRHVRARPRRADR